MSASLSNLKLGSCIIAGMILLKYIILPFFSSRPCDSFPFHSNKIRTSVIRKPQMSTCTPCFLHLPLPLQPPRPTSFTSFQTQCSHSFSSDTPRMLSSQGFYMYSSLYLESLFPSWTHGTLTSFIFCSNVNS